MQPLSLPSPPLPSPSALPAPNTAAALCRARLRVPEPPEQRVPRRHCSHTGHAAQGDRLPGLGRSPACDTGPWWPGLWQGVGGATRTPSVWAEARLLKAREEAPGGRGPWMRTESGPQNQLPAKAPGSLPNRCFLTMPGPQGAGGFPEMAERRTFLSRPPDAPPAPPPRLPLSLPPSMWGEDGPEEPRGREVGIAGPGAGAGSG